MMQIRAAEADPDIPRCSAVTAQLLRTAVALAVLLTAAPGTAPAQRPHTANTLTRAEGQASPAAAIEDLSWIAGHWRGEALGGTAEEVWSPPLGGTMMGMFKLVREGKVAFYEILSLAPESGTLVLTLKHFNADLTGWEEKDQTVRFPLVKITPDAAYFDGMTFRRVSPDTLQVFVALGQEDGGVREAEFLYRRVRPGALPW